MKKLLLLLSICLTAHVLMAQQTYDKVIPATGISNGTVRLEIPVGTLNLNASGSDLISTKIQYSLVSWTPRMDLSKKNGTAALELSQKKVSGNQSDVENNWDVNLSKNTPLALFIQMGAGESKIDLGNSKVQKLEIQAGAVALDVKLAKSALREANIKAGVGELNLDLSGDWNHDLTLDIAGGMGEINLTLPKGTGVKLETSGFGSQDLSGLTKKGKFYINEAFGKTNHTLTIKAAGGLGSITVRNQD